MIKPKRLSKGGTIALISLSAGLAGESSLEYRWRLAKKRLENIGFKVEITENALKSNDFLHTNPELRAKDLMDALRNPKVNGIICMIGGSDTIRLLPYIDFNIIRDNPKVFVGYSDTTINHFMFYHAGVSSIYGPCDMVEFAKNISMYSYTIENFKKLTMSNQVPINIEPSPNWTSEFLDWNDIDNSKKAIYEVIHNKCNLFELPIVYNMNFGHTTPITSLPFGCNVEIDCDRKKVIIK